LHFIDHVITQKQMPENRKFNERLRELCAKTRALKAPSLRVLCATRREHLIKCSFSGGLKPATEGAFD